MRTPRPIAGLAVLAAVVVVPAPAAAHRAHVVSAGETLTGLAAHYGVSPAALAAANGLASGAFVISGTTLSVPDTTPAPAGGVATRTAAGAPAAAPVAGYRVRLGDTLSVVAARHGVGLAALAQANRLDPGGVLLTGATLRIPPASGAPATSAAAQPATAQAQPVAAPAPAGPQATGEQVSAGQVRSVAQAHGVPGDLAAAIAWQESGFDNSMRSVADARGVMQILPGTWSWIQSNLTGQRLDPASAADNVHAGSLYLGSLLRSTGGDPALAAAAYYQGLASVRRIGMLPATRRYVANVMALRSRFGG